MGVGIGSKAPLLFGRDRCARGAREQARTRGGLREELPRHPEMHDESTVVVELRDEVLSATRERPDRAPGERAPQPRGRRDEQVARLGGVDLADAPTDQQRLDAPPRHLDFG